MQEIWEKGLQVRRQQAFERAKRVQQMHGEGHSIGHIAKHFGVNPKTVKLDLKKDLTLLIENPDIAG